MMEKLLVNKKRNRMILAIIGVIAIIIVLALTYGLLSFNHKVEQERSALFKTTSTSEIITEKDLEKLPPLMNNYLRKVQLIGKPKKCNVVFKQAGTIKTDPKKDWLKLRAIQYVSAINSGFIWYATTFPLFIRDKYLFGIGEMKVNFLGLKDVMISSNPETTQSALGRYFGELIWFPVGFLDKDIRWEQINATTVKGTITKGGISLAGYFHFDEQGLINAFRGKRYKDIILEDFLGKAENYRMMDGLLIPGTMTAIWELEHENLEYFRAEISEYRISQ
jgi:hypothetical protein